jgi:hypothetical protein
MIVGGDAGRNEEAYRGISKCCCSISWLKRIAAEGLLVYSVS